MKIIPKISKAEANKVAYKFLFFIANSCSKSCSFCCAISFSFFSV